MANDITEVFSMMSGLVTVMSTFVGIMIFIAGIFGLYKYANDPINSNLGQSIFLIFFSVIMMVLPQTLKGLDSSLFPSETDTATYASKSSESKPYVQTPVVKNVQQSKPLIAKKDPIKIPEKPVDYTQFFIAVGSVVGVIVGGVLSVLGLMKLRTKLRIRKYQKIVAHVAELKNDFVTLSEHINTIDTCLVDIQTYKVSAPSKIKSLLDSMQNVLEHKKNMFNTAVKEIHETQPELKVYGGAA